MIPTLAGKSIKSINSRYNISTTRPANTDNSKRVALAAPSLPKSKENSQVLRRPNDSIERIKLVKLDGSYTRMPVFTDIFVYEQSRVERNGLPEILEDEDKNTPMQYIEDSKNHLLNMLKENLNLAVNTPSFTTSLLNYRRYHKKQVNV